MEIDMDGSNCPNNPPNQNAKRELDRVYRETPKEGPFGTLKFRNKVDKIAKKYNIQVMYNSEFYKIL